MPVAEASVEAIRMRDVVYEVRAVVEPELCDSFESYMNEQHVPDVMATGCFSEASFETVGEGEYQIRYRASRKDLDTYLRDHAPRLRSDVASHFPNGITLSRKEWTLIKHFA